MALDAFELSLIARKRHIQVLARVLIATALRQQLVSLTETAALPTGQSSLLCRLLRRTSWRGIELWRIRAGVPLWGWCHIAKPVRTSSVARPLPLGSIGCAIQLSAALYAHSGPTKANTCAPVGKPASWFGIGKWLGTPPVFWVRSLV